MEKAQSKFQISLKNLEKAYAMLSEALQMPWSRIVQDGAIQRFEFTVELSWKTLKLYLSLQNIQTESPRDCLKQAFKLGFIDHLDDWDELLTARNLVSHIYDEENADEIFELIKKKHGLMGTLIQKLKKA